MTAKLNCKLEDGLMPAEKIARVESADGKHEEVFVSENNISAKGELIASEIGRRKGEVLIELPRESVSGRWRIWVKESSLGG